MAPNPLMMQSVLVESMSMSFDEPEVDESLVPIDDELKRIAKEELGETPEIRSSRLASLRLWLSTQSFQCRTDRLFLLRFLRAQKFDLAKTFVMITDYMALKKDKPEWFSNLDPTDPQDYIQLIESGFVCVLPGRERSSNRRVLLNRASRFDPRVATSQTMIMRALVASAETLLEEESNQILGLTYLIDCNAMALRHCSIWSPSDACLLFNRCESCFPMRHRDICLIRLPFVLRAVVEAVKTLLSSKMRKRIRLIDTNNLDKMFEGVTLTKDLPGDKERRSEVQDVNVKWANRVRDNLHLRH